MNNSVGEASITGIALVQMCNKLISIV